LEYAQKNFVRDRYHSATFIPHVTSTNHFVDDLRMVQLTPLQP